MKSLAADESLIKRRKRVYALVLEQMGMSTQFPLQLIARVEGTKVRAEFAIKTEAFTTNEPPHCETGSVIVAKSKPMSDGSVFCGAWNEIGIALAVSRERSHQYRFWIALLLVACRKHRDRVVVLGCSEQTAWTVFPRQIRVTCPPKPDPATMRVPAGRGSVQETLEDEADKAFG